MDRRTLSLLGLLAEPAIPVLLALCEEQDRTVKELLQFTGSKSGWLRQKIELLVVYGLLVPGPQQQRSGRPAETWRAAATEELAAFQNQAREFSKALARSTERMVDEPVSPAHLRVAES